MTKPTVSIVIPAYNEENRIVRYLKQIKKYMKKPTSYTITELIVVNDGSKDDTARVAVPYATHVFTNKPNRGKGYSVKRGVRVACGDYVLFADADGATPIKELDVFMKLVSQGYDVIIGSRSLKGAKLKQKQPLSRLIIGKGFFLLVVLIAGLSFRDTQCGFKLFSRKAAKKIFAKQTIDRFGFDPELLFLAKKYGFSVKEQPVEWHDQAGSTVDPVRDSFRMLGELLRIRFNDLFGKY